MAGANIMLEIPQHFLSVTYNASCHPENPDLHGLAKGANCQHFAYELLRYYGLNPPNFRSSELWEDTQVTFQVTQFEPLDLLLWNASQESYGAHVSVYIGEDKVIHLSKQAGIATWGLEEFKKYRQYQYFIGAKRLIR
jgi:murein DD-endopeptidase / murein LD-carboxypeptidase